MARVASPGGKPLATSGLCTRLECTEVNKDKSPASKIRSWQPTWQPNNKECQAGSDNCIYVVNHIIASYHGSEQSYLFNHVSNY